MYFLRCFSLFVLVVRKEILVGDIEFLAKNSDLLLFKDEDVLTA